ncbi:MAG: PadR family transcriptional regulator [Rhodospirillaceae bacterium]
MTQSNPPFMSGVPELLILQQLARQDMYGYELVKAIRTVTGETISLGEGVVYPALHSLEKSGALKSTRRPVNGRTRVYYAVTAKGRRRLETLTENWHRIRNGIESALMETTYA